MNFGPIDIIIILFVFLISLIGYNKSYIKNISKIINLIVSIILTNLILSNLSNQFLVLNKNQDFVFLTSYILTFIFCMTLLGFMFELIIEQIDEIQVTPYLNQGINIVCGFIKGFILISFIMFGLVVSFFSNLIK